MSKQDNNQRYNEANCTDLDSLLYILSLEKRFYASFLSKLNKVETDKIPTAGVGFSDGGKLTLVYNKKWLFGLPLKNRLGVLEHEVLHIFWKHLTRWNPSENKADNNIINIGLDMAINQYIRTELEGIPDGLIYPEKYDLPNDMTADWYIEELRKKRDQFIEEHKFDDHSMMGKMVDGNGELVPVDANIDVEHEVGTLVDKVLADAKKHGDAPAFVKKEIERIEATTKHAWKRELKIFVNNVLSVNKKISQKRVNRRMAESEFFIAGKKKGKRPTILIVRDTSGSVFCDKVQQDFQNEILNIKKYADIWVADCDTEIHQCYHVRSQSDFKGYEGGGGTSFIPAFELAKKQGFEGIIYLTDTEGSFPERDKIGKLAKKTIWVTFNQENVSVPFGKHVNIKG